MHYTMSAPRPRSDQQSASRTPGISTGEVSEAFTDYPADLPPIVRELAADVTKDADTRFEKAVAL